MVLLFGIWSYYLVYNNVMNDKVFLIITLVMVHSDFIAPYL